MGEKRFFTENYWLWRRAWILLLAAGWLAGATVTKSRAQNAGSTPQTIRLAVVSVKHEASAAADLLTVTLSADGRVTLLERDQINKVLNEQALSVGGNYVKLGEMLGADGLIILDVADKDGGQFLSGRLVAVKPGVALGMAEYAYPLSEPQQWSQLMASQFTPLFPKLGVLTKDAVPISILNLRSAAASPETENLERQLTLLLHDRLMREPEIFVLERQRLELLVAEKDLSTNRESTFWNGSFLLEGVIDKNGFNSNSLTISGQLVSPDKKNNVTLEVSGSRTNLAKVIEELAAQTIAAIHKGTSAAVWNADDEARRYAEEAKWMLKWEMFDESRMASEAAWALGAQSRENAEVRVKAYLGIAGTPGVLALKDKRISYGRAFFEHRDAADEILAFASAPHSEQFAGMIRAAELWMEESMRIQSAGGKLDTGWLNLAVKILNQDSDWLRYYYFTAEAREGQEEKLFFARRLCREIDETVRQNPQYIANDSQKRLIKTEINYEAYWSERPEDTLQVYRSWLESGQWAAKRERFFHGFAEEVTAQRRSRDYYYISMVLTGDGVPTLGLAGWDWSVRQRCPELWNRFIDELCRSTNQAIHLEGLILRSSYSWSSDDFERNWSGLLNYARGYLDIVADVDADKKFLKDLQLILDHHRNALPEPMMRSLTGKAWDDFQNDFTETAKRRKEHKVSETRLEVATQYLKSRTNFDFVSFASLFINQAYTTQEARELLPLLTNYQAMIENTEPPPGADRFSQSKLRMQKMTARPWTAQAAKKLLDDISPPTNTVIAAPASAARAMTATNVIARTLPSYLTNAETAAMTIEATRFWALPGVLNVYDTQQRPGFSLGHIASWCYRDGRLWLEVLYTATDLGSHADFFSIDPQTFDTKKIEFRSELYTFFPTDNLRQFDVDRDYLYLAVREGIQRYSLRDQTWERFELAGTSRPERLGDRLFFVNANSVFEYSSKGEMQLLASSRRLPAQSVLDGLDHYNPGHLFLDPKGGINICTDTNVFVLPVGSREWKKLGVLPKVSWKSASLFDEGFIAESMSPGMGVEHWGMGVGSAKVEKFFNADGSRVTSPFRQYGMTHGPDTPWHWQVQMPGKELCMDGDCLWFMVDSAEPNTYTSTGADPSDKTVSLVRFKYSEPAPMVIPVHLTRPSSGGKAINSRDWLRLSIHRSWVLQATSAGLVAGKSGRPGFWLIPKGDLDAAVASVKARRVATRTETGNK